MCDYFLFSRIFLYFMLECTRILDLTGQSEGPSGALCLLSPHLKALVQLISLSMVSQYWILREKGV